MKIPSELIKEFARGNGAIFVGEELSAQAGLPTLKELTAFLAAEIGCPTDISPQKIAHYHELEHGRNLLLRRLQKELKTSNLQPTPVHQALLRLPTTYIFTTNYDNLLELASRQARHEFNLVVSDPDSNFWSSDQLQLTKLHGDIAQRDSIVITTEDYNLYAHTRPALTRLLAMALHTRTVLFLGYKATDANFRQLLSQVRVESGTLARNAFAVLINASKWEIKEMETLQIQVINLEVAHTTQVSSSILPLFRRQEPTTTSQDSSKAYQETLTTWLKTLHDQIEQEKRRWAKKNAAVLLPLREEPYKFLDYFEEQDAAIFHGRQDDTNLLVNLVQSHPLAVLYGESGTGKSSLLQTAVIPRLREEGYHLVYARPFSNPLLSLKRAILKTFPDSTSHTDSLAVLVKNGLPSNGHLVLILDQFEEVFTRHGQQTRRYFIRELVGLLNLPNRHVHCLLSLRNDYLFQLDEFNDLLDYDFLRYRMRLHNLGPSAARAAIIGPATSFEINIDPLLLDQLLLDLRQVDIAPAQLQIVCYILWNDWKNNLGQPETGLSLARYRELGGTTTILADYLDHVIGQLANPNEQRKIKLELEPQTAQDATRTILKRMITAEQTKVAVSGREITESIAIEKLQIAPDQATQLLTYLRNKRIIRRLPDSNLYELSHEVMIKKVWEWVSDEEEHLLNLQDMLARATSDYQRLGILLSSDKLTLLTEGAAQLWANHDALELLLVSAIEHETDTREWVSKLDSEQAVEILAKLLESQRQIRYPKIAQALGYTQSAKAISHLQPLLANKKQNIQRAAIDALVEIGLPQVIKPLYYAARQEHKLPRITPILQALETLANEESLEALLLLVSDPPNPLRPLVIDTTKELSAPDDSSTAEESHLSHLFATKNLLGKERGKALNSEISTSDDSPAIVKPLIMTEGKTDWKHLKAAWQRLKADGHFDELEIEFLEYEEDIKMGSGDLKNFCIHASKAPQDRPIICIFDCDEANISKAVSVADKKYKDWGNKIFSFTIPVPAHRQKTPKISIEFYYTDAEIMQPDKQSRRLFLSSEFYASSRHKSEDLTCTDLNKIKRKDVSIIDQQVFNKQHKNVALPKNKFANYILQQKEGFHEFDVSPFIKIFDIIVMIQQENSPQG